MSTHFAGILENNGFDGTVNPPWLMIPLGGIKHVSLLEGRGLNLVSSDPSVISVSTSEPFSGTVLAGARIVTVTVRGLRPGTAFIEARQGTSVKARLEVAVKRPKAIRVAFNFVRDNAGHQTRRTPASVSQYLAVMNRIYTPQSNIHFRRHTVRWVTVNKNLGNVVRFSSHLHGVPTAQHEWDDVSKHADSTADFNVFFVWEYEQDNTPYQDHTDAGTLGSNCLFEDRAGVEVGETLAHEAGHFLGGNDTYASSDRPLLMYGYTDLRGRKISKPHASIMNP